MKIELNIFTNSIPSAPEIKMIEKTYNSFVDTFGLISDTRIWYDPKPKIEKASEYRKNLEIFFSKKVIDTFSLSDGYIKAIKTSDSDFMFMLEHDWFFEKNLITHSLEEIAEEMILNEITHFRFNKRKNEIKNQDRWIKEGKYKKVPFCYTPYLSNNPHIIYRKLYLEKEFPKIKLEKGSKGIEHNLYRTEGAIYGPLGFPNTITHLDGKEQEDKISEIRKKRRARRTRIRLNKKGLG
jgi:hypothetical protein